MIVSPLFWEWFNIWLTHFLKDLYHEIKMVALRGTNCSVNSMPHACMNHGNQSQQGSIDLSQGLQTSLNMSQGGVAQHMNANQLNGPPLSSVSVQFVPQQNNTNPLKRDRAPSQYANSNCMPSSHHYRLLTQSRAECWNPSGASGGGYMSSGVAGGQGQAQPTLRVQPNPQPSAPPAPQQDMSKTTMSGHNFVAPQNPTPQPRGQYPNFPYRPNQHGSRTNTHQRPQQPFMPNASATASAPVMYHPPTLVFQPHMVPPSYQQPRSTTPGYYQYVPQPYLGYTTPASHTPPYYYPSNNQQLPGQNLPNNPPGGRNNPTTMVGPQGTPVTAAAPTASIPHPQPTGHMHQPMPGTRQVPTKRSHRVPIIDPVTQQDILSELYSDNNSQYLSGESSERQTPQPESSPSIAEEFTRMVNEVANQPTVNESTVKASFVKNTDVPISSTSNATPHSLAINNHIKSELIVNEKSLGPDVAVESTDTPIVSAISDSPVIVPKMPINIKQIPKSSDPLPVAVDTSKNVSAKQQKQNRSKPLVPQGEDDEKVIENAVFEKSAMPVAPAGQAVVINAPVQLQPQPQPQTQTQPQPQPQLQPQPQPQPQRIREPRERLRSEEKEKDKKAHAKEAKPEPEPVPFTTKLNGPSPFNVISSVDSLPETINSPTSPSIQQTTESSKKQTSKQVTPVTEIDKFKPLVTNSQTESKNKTETPAKPLTATELLSASIEKCARLPLDKEELEEEKVEVSNAIQAQAKLTQSLISCLRNHQPEPNMKDVNLNKTSDPDTANGNNIEITITETVEEDINRNEKVVKNNQSSNKKSAMLANNESVVDETSYENGTEEETDTLSSPEQDAESEESEKDDSEVAGDSAANPGSTAFLPKYKYTEEQWSPLNKSGKKTYDISLLKQIKEDPLSKNKPSDAARLEACNVIRASPLLDTPLTFNISRPANDSIMFPNFFPKSAGVGPRNSAPRDAKKDSRNMPLSGKGSVKLQSPGGGGSTHKPVIHVSLSLREEVKLNQSKDAWKPGRFKKENLDEEELKTQELYRRFRGILNKLTPQKFDTLLEKVKSLEINNQKRLEGVIDLVFEKAIDEPNFSEAYAAMCNKLSVLKVPADNAPADQYVNFRALIINKCQNQFVTEKVDEQVLKLEKEFAECTEPTKKRELQLMLNEENRRVRMRSVGNVRFIGELYKLKMLTAKIMVFCMNYLIDKLEEEKLECLCKLLTTIGEQVESEVKEQLDTVFKKMVDIVERKSNKISSRVRFMIQDVIELRRRRWVAKNVVDLQPKMMDQIQKEAEQQQRHIELMNAAPMGGFRRDDGGRGKRGDSRRQNFNEANNWKLTRTNYVVDTSKLLKVTQKNISNIKLAPQNSGWNHGSGTKNTAQTAASNSMISLTKNNMYSMLENVQTDPATLRSNKDVTPNYSKGASIERSTFNSRGDFSSGSGSRSGSVTVPRSTSSTRAEATPPPPAAIVPQEPLPESQQKTVQSVLDLWIMNNPGDDAELAAEVKHLFKPQHHAAVVTQIVTIATQKSVENNALIAKSLAHLVSTNIIAADNVLTGLAEVLEFAPDTYIDVPLLYDNIAKFLALHIEKKHITLAQIFRISDAVISANQSNLLLKAIIRELRDSMGPSFVRSKWQESGIPLKKWMNADQVPKWLEENNFEFLEGETNVNEDTKNILSPAQTQNKLLQLMNADESCECIKGWIQDNLGHAATEDWFMRALIQAICEHALFGAEGRDVPHFNQDRMNKYCGLIEFGDSRQAREASCLFGIQQLIHRLEHPQGITLEIFQYLHEQYIINVEGFIAWEISKDEPEGKAVMLKALTSFFTNIKEADNEDSGSED